MSEPELEIFPLEHAKSKQSGLLLKLYWWSHVARLCQIFKKIFKSGRYHQNTSTKYSVELDFIHTLDIFKSVFGLVRCSNSGMGQTTYMYL